MRLVMARPQNRKSLRADGLLQEEDDPRAVPPEKKIKTGSEIELEPELDAWESWKYPPQFWDSLSKIELTRRALEELNRRTKTRYSLPSPLQPRTTTSGDLARFTRHGGPDLRDLRGVSVRRGRPSLYAQCKEREAIVICPAWSVFLTR